MREDDHACILQSFGSLAWASDQIQLAGSSATTWAELDLA
jgi:hypothetical protein